MYMEDCALALINERHYHPGHLEINYIWDMSSQHFSIKVRQAEWYVSDLILLTGLLLNISNIKIHRTALLAALCLANVVLSLPNLFMLNPRFGWDYVAYLQQAGAVYHGERNYTKLSSTQGPAYYAAGHIYHYLVAYWVHLQTESAEQIIKLVHILVHTLAIFFASKISFIYFADKN